MKAHESRRPCGNEMIKIWKKQENKPVDVAAKNGGNTNKSRKSRKDHHELDLVLGNSLTEKH